MKQTLLTPFLALVLIACGDNARRPIGESCGDDSACASGLCLEERCVDPEGDDDDDGLVNRVEAALGTSPNRDDTDGDGISDRDELDAALGPIDEDGDGRIDALESTLLDADGDCVADQYDADDATAATDIQFLVDIYCPRVGVCAEGASARRVACGGEGVVAVCELTGVEGYESAEVSCDGVDNDCDGAVDEGLGPNGDGVCATDDPCATANGGCEGSCVAADGVATCGCAEGFALNADGKACDDVDECATANGGCAGTCTNTDGAFSCGCAEGFALNADGKACDDIDECATANGGCAGTCTNTNGTFTCGCGDGYALGADGKACDDIDECNSNNGGCAGPCTNTDGGFSCGCADGYALGSDGTSCVDIDECEAGNGGCAAGCENTDGAYRCTCPSGYALASNGTDCEDINECDADNGGCEHLCNNTDGSFSCTCGRGYAVAPNGLNCINIDDCEGVDCGPNGTCRDLVAAFTCDCAPGYSGSRCETPVCAGGCGAGTCSAPNTCACAGTGYEGSRCEIPICTAGCGAGTCTAPDTCDCELGSVGPTCDGLLAFVSSAGLVGGTLGNGGTSDDVFDRASAHCERLALEAGFEGRFVGWLSTRAVKAVDQIPATAGPWYRADNRLVATRTSAFIAGTATNLVNPIALDELGSDYDGPVLTGTFSNGAADLERNCSEWRSTTSIARTGTSTSVDLKWTEGGDGACGEATPIYCLQIPARKRIFLSSRTRTGDLGGLDGADTLCADDARNAGLGGTWRAWLSSTNTGARDRMLQYPFGYENMPGDLVALDFADLIDGSIKSSLAFLADGTPMPTGTAATWTGTDAGGKATGVNCANWTSTSGSGTVGLSGQLSELWTFWNSWSCAEPAYHLCVEQ